MPGVLYRKEREVLEYLAQFQKQYGYSPTLSEISHATGHKSNSTVHTIIRALVEKGYVQKVDGNTRVLKIIDEKAASGLLGQQPSIELPLMGFIAAGKPLEPHTDPNATFQVSASMISGKKTAYVLQVKGESMIEEGILDGDFVVIEKTDVANNGDIVVALVDDEATVKKIRYDKDVVILKPESKNKDHQPIILADDFQIQGVVVSVLANFD